MDFANPLSSFTCIVRTFTSRSLAFMSRSSCWQRSPRSLTGCRSSTSARANLASSLASLRSFLVLDSVTILSFDGLATIAFMPSDSTSRFIHRQCAPVSNTTGQSALFPERYARSPSFVVGIVVSSRIRLAPRSFAMTQTFVVRSLTSMPIVV